jgi:AcrR family transcriptional regulator
MDAIRSCIVFRMPADTTPSRQTSRSTAVTTPRLTARRRATRDRVLEAASEVFAERGFHGASVEDICERAGFTRGAFYSNFASKDDLVLALSTRQMERVVERITAAARTEDSPEAVLAAVLAALADEPDRHERSLLLTTEFTLHAIRDPEARAAWAAQQREVREAVVAAVDDAVDARGLTLPVSTEQLVLIAMALSQATATQRLVEPGALETGELERLVLPLLLGLATRRERPSRGGKDSDGRPVSPPRRR